MRTIYRIKVLVPNGPFNLERTFWFASNDQRNLFTDSLPHDVKIVAFGIDHVISPADALAEVERERRETLSPAA